MLPVPHLNKSLSPAFLGGTNEKFRSHVDRLPLLGFNRQSLAICPLFLSGHQNYAISKLLGMDSIENNESLAEEPIID